MFDTKRVSRDFSQAAAGYDSHASLQRRVLSNLLARAKPLISSPARILDAGCGTGLLASLLAPQNVTGIDIAYAMCARAAARGSTAVNGTMESLPFADGAFDVVISSLALQWLSDWREGLRELRRVVKTGGVLAISTLGEGTLKELKESFAATDHYPHVSEFLPVREFQQTETMVEYFPSLYSLMQHLKALGARNKLLQQRKTLTTQNQMLAVEAYYREHFGESAGLPVTWEILYSVTRNL